MRESYIESEFRKRCEQNRWLCLKLTHFNGIPDRLVIFPDGKVSFVELKRPGGRVRAIQAHTIAQLISMGHDAVILDSIDALREWVHAKGGQW